MKRSFDEIAAERRLALQRAKREVERCMCSATTCVFIGHFDAPRGPCDSYRSFGRGIVDQGDAVAFLPVCDVTKARTLVDAGGSTDGEVRNMLHIGVLDSVNVRTVTLHGHCAEMSFALIRQRDGSLTATPQKVAWPLQRAWLFVLKPELKPVEQDPSLMTQKCVICPDGKVARTGAICDICAALVQRICTECQKSPASTSFDGKTEFLCYRCFEKHSCGVCYRHRVLQCGRICTECLTTAKPRCLLCSKQGRNKAAEWTTDWKDHDTLCTDCAEFCDGYFASNPEYEPPKKFFTV